MRLGGQERKGLRTDYEIHIMNIDSLFVHFFISENQWFNKMALLSYFQIKKETRIFASPII